MSKPTALLTHTGWTWLEQLIKYLSSGYAMVCNAECTLGEESAVTAL